MSWCNHGPVSGVLVPEIRDGCEDLERDPADRGKPVSPGPDEVEDFESILLKNVDIEEAAAKRQLISAQVPKVPFEARLVEGEMGTDATRGTDRSTHFLGKVLFIELQQCL